MADDSFCSVSGKGSNPCAPTLTLSFILHVPNFPTNLLPISSITKDLNCKVSFYPIYCVFQKLKTEQTIGYDRIQDGLYLLKTGLNSSTNTRFASQVSHLKSLMPTQQQLLQWHQS